MRLKSHLVAAILGIISLVVGIIGFVISMATIVNVIGSIKPSTYGTADPIENIVNDSQSFISKIFLGVILAWVIPGILGIGVFAAGIVEVVQSNQTTENKGIGLTAGILNIIFGFSIFIPIIGWILPIVGIVFAFVAYFKNIT